MTDLYQSVTDRIVAALDQGTPPWVRPWSGLDDAIPVNAQTRRRYRGINFALLSLESEAKGYDTNRWLTYRQAHELGAQVRKGEHGVPVVFWQMRKVAAKAEAFPDDYDSDPPPQENVFPLLRCYTVFNVAQVNGLPEHCEARSTVAWEPEARAEELILMSSARLRNGGAKAYYRPDTDEIYLPPPAAFTTSTGYYNVALHELTHWTGHPSRCNRQLAKRFGEEAYAAEELVAEMGAAYLCAHCRLDGELRHASYIASWLRVLRNDKRAIFTAAARAQRAADYVLTLANPTAVLAVAA
jgi:antirestriction protein ArdC